MEIGAILESLRYAGSPNFLVEESLASHDDFGHIFRRAQKYCGLVGTYMLDGSAYGESRGSVPVVFVCEAESEEGARLIHRRVWNQNVVPFLLVVSPAKIRLYPGFDYARDSSDDPLQGALRAFNPKTVNLVAAELESIRADSIDSGRIWQELGRYVNSEQRVDWQLLRNLRQLDQALRSDGVADQRLSHAMIGKFVYLHYLRQRNILSNERLSHWNIEPASVFAAQADIQVFITLIQRLDEWLNGSVFPLTAPMIERFGADRLRRLASVFQGEQVDTGQLPLFDIYDFSYIPIETLSVIYEQFLHDTPNSAGVSEGNERKAYYTPVPLVNFMLDRLDTKKQLRPGMRVLDAACGSGAFLVQCYRKLVERQTRQCRRRLKLVELRELLTRSIFGVDIDEDACQIAELSLLLTLLDYVDPPDLTNTKWKLPDLRNKNVFRANAFDDGAVWYRNAQKERFDWIVGNPPWKELGPDHLDPPDQPAWAWMLANQNTQPVGGNQLAEAFAWRVTEIVGTTGVIALLMPAMTLFKNESLRFRSEFFSTNHLWAVANFANLSNVLFAGRVTVPAAALFYSKRIQDRPRVDATIETYSPMLANQPASASRKSRGRPATWNLIVNGSELREVLEREVLDGQTLPWKLAMWGSSLDARVLSTVERKFPTFGDLEKRGLLLASQGLELRPIGAEGTEPHPELAGKATVNVKKLKNRRYLFRFPDESIDSVELNRTSVREGRFDLPSAICAPPHIVVGESRNFAVYSDEYLIVPPGQIGIVSPNGDQDFLKALALYLNSDFVLYHQFFVSTQAGVQKTISTLRSLRTLPVPFSDGAKIAAWRGLFERLAQDCGTADDFDSPELVEELNEFTFKSLELSSRSRAAVHDLVRVRFGLVRGKAAPEAVGQPDEREQILYAETLREELDAFLRVTGTSRHAVSVLSGGNSGVVAIDLVESHTPRPVKICKATEAEGRNLEYARARLIEKRAQWVYFQRNLRVYEGLRTYLLKPLQRMHWTRTQAIQDAQEIIADCLQPEGVHREARVS